MNEANCVWLSCCGEAGLETSTTRRRLDWSLMKARLPLRDDPEQAFAGGLETAEQGRRGRIGEVVDLHAAESPGGEQAVAIAI